jgi:hypothetical protein
MQILKNLDPNLKYTYNIVVVPDLIHTHCHLVLNLKHTDSLPALMHADPQSKQDLESFWKHVCSPPLLLHPQKTVLKMMISFLSGEGQGLDTKP